MKRLLHALVKLLPQIIDVLLVESKLRGLRWRLTCESCIKYI